MEAFEYLPSQVRRLPHEQSLGYFMSGLKPHMSRRVRMLNFVTRMQIMRIAKDVEDELNEEDDNGNRLYRKKNGGDHVGRHERVGLMFNSRGGSNPSPKDTTRFTNPSGSNPSNKMGLVGTSPYSSSSLFSTG